MAIARERGYDYIIQPEVIVQAKVVGTTMQASCPAQIYPRQLIRLNINGPVGSSFALYKNFVADENRLDSTQKGMNNTADYPNPIFVGPGTSLIAVWNLNSATANATFYFDPRAQ